QEGCRLELVIVDDGCAEPIEACMPAARDRRIRIVRIAHGGQPSALNAGIAAAAGEWFRFVDADGGVPPDSARCLMDLADREDSVSYGSTLVCDSELQPRKVIRSTVAGDAVAECLLGRFHTRHPSMLFSRRIVETAGSWDEQFDVSADWDFVLRALEHASV